MTAKHRPAEKIIFGCWMAVFGGGWAFVSLVAVFMSSFLVPAGEMGGSRLSLTLHHLAMWSPFLLIAWLFFGVSFRHIRRARLRPEGLGRVRRTPLGWEVEFPHILGGIVAAVVFAALVAASAYVPLLILGKRNPAWFWAIVLPVAAGLATLTSRKVRYRPLVVIDESARTLELPRGRRTPALVVPWNAVTGIEVVRCPGDETDDEYVCDVTVQHEGQPVSVRLKGEDSPEPAERFAAWLRERLQQPQPATALDRCTP